MIQMCAFFFFPLNGRQLMNRFFFFFFCRAGLLSIEFGLAVWDCDADKGKIVSWVVGMLLKHFKLLH